MGRGGPEFVYRIEVTPVEPRLTIGLPERTQFVDIVAPVPKGNRMAIMLSAQREDFGGDVNLEMNGLPAKVAAQILPISGDQGMVPVLLSAPADAQLAAALVDVIGKHKEGDRTMEGRLVQKTHAHSRRQQPRNLDLSQQPPGDGRDGGGAVPYRDRPTQGAAGAKRRDGAKVTAMRDKGFKGAHHAPHAIQSARRLFARIDHDPRRTKPGGDSAHGRRRRVDPQVENRRARRSRTWAMGRSSSPRNWPTWKWPSRSCGSSSSPAVVEQGQKTSVVVKIEKTRKLDSPATVELLGLPNEVTTEPRQIDDAASEVIFPIATTAKSPVGPASDARLPRGGQVARRADHAHRGRRRVADPAALAAEEQSSPPNRRQSRRRKRPRSLPPRAAQPAGAIAGGKERAEPMSKIRKYAGTTAGLAGSAMASCHRVFTTAAPQQQDSRVRQFHPLRKAMASHRTP